MEGLLSEGGGLEVIYGKIVSAILHVDILQHKVKKKMAANQQGAKGSHHSCSAVLPQAESLPKCE